MEQRFAISFIALAWVSWAFQQGQVLFNRASGLRCASVVANLHLVAGNTLNAR
jgi:hypothetical protein